MNEVNAAPPSPPWASLAATVSSGASLVLPSSPSYANSSVQWNTRFKRTPAAVLYVVKVTDVESGLVFARSYNVPLSVRSGGHNTEGWAVCDGCLVIDVSRMKNVNVDTTNQVADVQLGIGLLDYDIATIDTYGLMSPTGICPSVSLAGYSQGGGIGWTSRSQGLMIDTVARYEITLWNGTTITAGVPTSTPNSRLPALLPIGGEPNSEVVNEDLFWALRGGGGGNFGIVTSATLVLSPAPTSVLYAEYSFSEASAPNVTRMFLTNSDHEFCFFLLFIQPAPGQVMLLMQGIWNGNPDDGRAALKPFDELAAQFNGSVSLAEMTYSQAKANFSAGLHQPIAGKQKSAFVSAEKVEALAEEGSKVIVEAVRNMPQESAPHSTIYMNHMGSAINAPARDDTAFPHRTYAANVVIDAHWELETEMTEATVAWSRVAFKDMSPYLDAAVYINYLDRDLCEVGQNPFSAAWHSIYYAENYQRLSFVKSKYDPENLFTWPQAINSACDIAPSF